MFLRWRLRAKPAICAARILVHAKEAGIVSRPCWRPPTLAAAKRLTAHVRSYSTSTNGPTVSHSARSFRSASHCRLFLLAGLPRTLSIPTLARICDWLVQVVELMQLGCQQLLVGQLGLVLRDERRR